MLTVKQASERLNVSAATIYALVSTGKLPGHRVGVGRGVIRIAEADISAYLDECRTDVPARTSSPKTRLTLKHIKL